MEESFATLDKFLRTQIALRKKEFREDLKLGRNFEGGRRDVFSFLVRANEDVEEKYPLDDNELVRIQFHVVIYENLLVVRSAMFMVSSLLDMVKSSTLCSWSARLI